MNKRTIRKINKLLLNLDTEKIYSGYNPINNEYSLSYFKKVEKVLSKSAGDSKVLLTLMSELLYKENLHELIILLYMGYRVFYDINILNEKNKNGENFIQVAINTGYDHIFIENLLKKFGKNNLGCSIDCNTEDKYGNTIMHTSLLNNHHFFDYFAILNALHKYTNFNQYNHLNNKNESIVDLIEKKYNDPIFIDVNNFSVYTRVSDKECLLSLFYNINFDLFMKQLTDDVSKNNKLIAENMEYSDYLGEHHKLYNLKFPHQLLHLCVAKKYDDEKFVLTSIKRLIATGKMDVNYLENNLDIVSVAIINGYSDEFVINLIKELFNTNFDKKHYFQIMYSAIYLSNIIKRNVYEIYELLNKNGFNLIDEEPLINDSLICLPKDKINTPLTSLTSYSSSWLLVENTIIVHGYGLLAIQREDNIAQFLKKIIESLKEYNIDIEIDNLREYDECYRNCVKLQECLKKEPRYMNRKLNISKSIAKIINNKYRNSIMHFDSSKLKDELIKTLDIIYRHRNDLEFIFFNICFDDCQVFESDILYDYESSGEFELTLKQLTKKHMKN